MYISSFQVKNYKSFRESSTLKFTTGFNLIVGQNNAGKTALLEALTTDFSSKPYRSLKGQPRSSSTTAPWSCTNLSFKISGEELSDILSVPENTFRIPLPQLDSQFAASAGYVDETPASLEQLRKYLFSLPEVTFSVRYECNQNSTRFVPLEFPAFGMYEAQRVGERTDRFRFGAYTVRSDMTTVGQINNIDKNADDLGQMIPQHALRKGIYSFQAERYKVGRCAFGDNRVLAPDAGNLPQVLFHLQGNKVLFEEFNSRVTEIIPQVRWISVHPLGSELEVRVWNYEPKTKRDDLAIELGESGTGIGQVLAILYVVLTSDFPRTIIIDEPQSFLHPGAIRKLIDILKSYPQHQFVISTHSPTVIAAANPATVTLVRYEEYESVCELLDINEVEQQRRYLTEIGAKLSDVFGADDVLWVEGKTEELCFPIILETIAKRPLMGTVIKGVKQTGDFQTRHSSLVFDLYDRLSSGKSLLPTAVGFLFDWEGRSGQEMKEMQNRTTNPVKFTKRRTYENYLLHPSSIVEVMNSLPDFRETPVTEKEVENKIAQEKSKAKYYKRRKVKAKDYLTHINAPLLLKEIFQELSESRYSYEKLRDSVALTEQLIERAPDELNEIADLIVGILDTKN